MRSISTNVKLFAILLFTGAIFAFVMLWSFHFQNQMLEQKLAHERREGSELIDKIVSLGSVSLQSFTNGYSRWDEMGQFVETRDSNWAKINVGPALSIFNLDAAWICDTSVSPIYGVDNRGDSLASTFPLSAEDRDSIAGSVEFRHFFARTKCGLMEIRQAPIQPTDDTLRRTPAKGYFVVGRLWSATHLPRFAQLAGSQLTIEYSKERMDSLSSQNTQDATINIYSLLKDLRGQTTAYLVAPMELTEWRTFRHFLRTQLGLIVAFLLVVLLTLAFVFHYWISRPLLAISHGLIQGSPELPASLLRQNSEFGNLARLIRESVGQKRRLEEEITQRKIAEETLEVFKESLDNSTDAIGMSTPQGIHYYQNREFDRLFSHVGERPPETIYVDKKVGEEVFRTIMSGETWTGEVKMYARDRQILDILLRAYANKDKNGNITSLVGIHTDITVRKLAEENKEKMLLRQQDTSRLLQSLLVPAPLEDRLRKVTDAIVRLFDADFCRIWLIRPGDLCERGCIHAEVHDGPHVCRHRDRCLHLLTSSGRYTHIDGKGHRRVPFGCYKIGRVASGEDHKFVTNDARNDPSVHDHAWVRDLGLVSFAGYQLRAPGGETLGVLALFAKHPISVDEDAILEGIGSTVVLVVKQAVAEESLFRSETKFRTLYDSTGDAVMLLDEKGFFDCNKATLTIFGCATRDEFCSKHPGDVSPSKQPCGTDSLTLANQRIATAIEKGNNHFEWTHKKVDTGELFYADVLLNAMELNGKPVVQAVVRDISERTLAEARLQESESLYRALIETTGTGYVIIDDKGRLLDANPEYVRLTGHLELDEIRGKSVVDWTADYEKEKNAEAVEECSKKGYIRNLEIDYVDPKGKITPVEVNATVIERSGTPIILSICRDITERKMAEDALRESREVLRAILDSIPVRVFWKDENLVYLGCNTPFARDAGFEKPEDIIGKDDHAMGWREQADFYRADDRAVIENGEARLNFEEPQTTPSGELIYLLTCKIPLRDAGGAIIGLLGTYYDITDRKRAEDELRKLSQAVEQSPSSVVITDVYGSIEYVNPKFCEITGYSSAEAIGQNPRILSSGLTPKETYDRMWLAIAAGQIWTGEFLNRKKNGELFWERANISGIRDATGTITHYIGLKEDITEQKRIEDERSRFIAVIDEAPESIAILNADGSIMYVNHAFEKISDISFGQAAGHYYEALARKLYANKDYEIPWDRVQAGESWTDSITYQGSDGGFRLMDQSVSPIRSRSGEIINYVVFNRDVTEERELEIRARWADERLRLSIDGMVDGLTLWDVRTAPDGSIQEFVCSEANPASLKMLGKERQDAVGSSVRELLKGAEDHDPHELFLRVHERGQSLTIDHLHFLKDNQRLILTIHVWAIGTGIACHLRDVTQQLELETQLRQAQKLEAVGSLAAGIAHEINTPIQFVGDNIRFLADSFAGLMNVLEHHRECREKMAPLLGEREELQQLRDLDKQVDVDYLKTEIPMAVEQSLEGVSRVSTIVRAMKDFSHIDEREMVLADINQMLDTTLTVARNELKYVADVAKDFAPDLPTVECFRNDLNQVFLNLLVNAAHAIGDVLSAEGQGRGTITVATSRDGDEVVVSISDTGGGIPENIRDRIFDHFFTTKEVGKGTGQGLSIARSIVVEKHKGAITFDSEIGKGTTFHIRLPITRREVEHAESQHPVRG